MNSFQSERNSSPASPSDFSKAAFMFAQNFARIKEAQLSESSDSSVQTTKPVIVPVKPTINIAKDFMVGHYTFEELVEFHGRYFAIYFEHLNQTSDKSEAHRLSFKQCQEDKELSAMVETVLFAFAAQDSRNRKLLLQLYLDVFINTPYALACEANLLALGPLMPSSYQNQHNFLTFVGYSLFLMFNNVEVTKDLLQLLETREGMSLSFNYISAQQREVQLFAVYLAGTMQVEGASAELVHLVDEVKRVHGETMGMYCQLMLHYEVILNQKRQ